MFGSFFTTTSAGTEEWEDRKKLESLEGDNERIGINQREKGKVMAMMDGWMDGKNNHLTTG